MSGAGRRSSMQSSAVVTVFWTDTWRWPVCLFETAERRKRLPVIQYALMQVAGNDRTTYYGACSRGR